MFSKYQVYILKNQFFLLVLLNLSSVFSDDPNRCPHFHSIYFENIEVAYLKVSFEERLKIRGSYVKNFKWVKIISSFSGNLKVFIFSELWNLKLALYLLTYLWNVENIWHSIFSLIPNLPIGPHLSPQTKIVTAFLKFIQFAKWWTMLVWEGKVVGVI